MFLNISVMNNLKIYTHTLNQIEISKSLIEEKDQSIRKFDLAPTKVPTTGPHKSNVRDCDEAIWKGWFELIGPNKNVRRFLKQLSSYEYTDMFNTLELGENILFSVVYF